MSDAQTLVMLLHDLAKLLLKRLDLAGHPLLLGVLVLGWVGLLWQCHEDVAIARCFTQERVQSTLLESLGTMLDPLLSSGYGAYMGVSPYHMVTRTPHQEQRNT